MSSPVISKTTVKRLINDIKELSENSLSKDGIYYKHDESNMLVGYALIIGPTNTPYAAGNFLFKFNFPQDYPYSPPIVTYHTNDGFTRFNPNLYKNTKVCISLLNTWKGEQWTSCQTIKSILLTLCSILNETPLLNEPGITKEHSDLDVYNQIIKYRTLDTAIGGVLNGTILAPEFSIFDDEIKENFIKNYKYILDDITDKKNIYLSCGIYNLSVKTNYKKLNDLFREFHEKFRIS
jgi:ubiquitin-protein ligase